MNPVHERKLRENWTFLKHELAVEDLSDKLIEQGIFTDEIRYEIKHVQPNTRFMKAEKFLQFLIDSGDKGYDTFCNLLRREGDNMYRDVIEKLEISMETSDTDKSKPGATNTQSKSRGSIIKQSSLAHRPVPDQRTSTNNSSRIRNHDTEENVQQSKTDVNTRNESETKDGKHGSRPTSTNIQAANKQNDSSASGSLPERSVPDGSSRNNSTMADEKGPDVAGAAAAQVLGAASSSFSVQDSAFTVDMKDLEHELVRMAPQIAELFKRISRSNPSVKATKNELQDLKGENERLRKANRSLVEKLNIFQQKIIQLQLENKRLRDSGLNSRDSLLDIMNRAEELAELEKKLTEQKRELDEKEKELNEHLRKIAEIEKENEEQKRQIINLEKLHEENVKERTKQKVQINELKEDKEKHQKQIEFMEELQRKDEERFLRLEHRLRLLEQASMPRYRPNGEKEKRRAARVMSPPKAMPWMSGVVNRSHHANVKFTPPNERDPREPLAPTEKGWAL